MCMLDLFVMLVMHMLSQITERVAFVGISNWALDPAKMNRGIMVTRDDPGQDELAFSARFLFNFLSMAHVSLCLSNMCLVS